MNEEYVLVLLARYELSIKEIEKIKEKIEINFDWYKFFILALNNKIIGLAYFNLKRYKLLCRMKPIILHLMEYYYYCNKKRNVTIMQEKRKIVRAMQEKNIQVLSLKGGVLLDQVYCDYGSRTCNDLDFFCFLQDLKDIDQIVTELGYSQGEYDWNTEEINEFSRIKKLGWKMNLNTVPTYIKKIDNNDFIDFLEIDFSYSFDLRKDVSIAESVFANSIGCEMNKIDFVVHLCSHLYKEAENDIWIEAKADLNLIKFCDIRESLKKFTYKEVDSLIKRSIELKCWDAVIYCSYYLSILYGEDYARIISKFKAMGYELAETKYDKLDYSKESKEHFWKRIFAYDNTKELLPIQYIQNKKIIEQKGENDG